MEVVVVVEDDDGQPQSPAGKSPTATAKRRGGGAFQVYDGDGVAPRTRGIGPRKIIKH